MGGIEVANQCEYKLRNGGSIEEIADENYDPDLLNSVVIPLMANNRIAMCKSIDKENEIHKNEWYITTAGTKQSYAYQKMKEIYNDMIEMLLDERSKKSAFCIGAGYELPCMHEHLDIDFIMEQKESPTFNPMGFMREYESKWTGSSEKSLVSIEALNNIRVLTEAEFKNSDKNCEYILSYDVARAEGKENAQSVLIVFKIKEKHDGTYNISVVNIYSFEGTRFKEQAIFLKKKVNEFKAKILIIDANGLGSGLVDRLTEEIDENPIYHVVNDSRYNKYRTADSIPMIFNIKSNMKDMKATMIHNVFVNFVNNKRFKILKSSSSVKNDLSKKNKNNTEKIAEALTPYLITDIMCDEIMNLEYKQSGNDTDIKQISKAINKDKFSALEYGLFWIHLQERENTRKKEQKLYNINDLMKSFKKPKAKL